MIIFDADATFERLGKLQERIDRLEKDPNPQEWQYTRLLIQALTEGIAKSKKSPVPSNHKIRVDAPDAVHGDWQELVDVLSKKGIKTQGRRRASK